MKMIVLGSGSAGNGYLLVPDTGRALQVDAGTPIEKTNMAVGIENLAGVIISHKHGDHYKYARKFEEYGKPVIMGEHKKKFEVEGFVITPLKVPHDVDCVAYVIGHEEMGRLLFATDLSRFPYRIPGLNNIMIECNHVPEHVEYIEPVKRRVLSTHLSLEKCLEALRNQDLRAVSKIVLLHGSIQLDKREAVEIVSRETGKFVCLAEGEIEMGLCPF